MSSQPVRSGRLPLIMVILSGLVMAVGVVLMFAGGQQVGATWDERIHAVMLEHYFDTGWYGSPDWFVNGEPVTPIGRWPYFVYAPMASLLVHVWAGLTGAEPWAGFSDSAAAHAAHHVGTALMGVLGVVAVVLIARIITRSWRWSALAGALLCSVPMWVGHSMFNVKDLPVGVGYTLVTLGFVTVLRPGYGHRDRRPVLLRVGVWAAIVAGILLAVGTRPASGFPMALTAGGLVVVVAVRWWRRRSLAGARSSATRRIVDVLGAFVLAYLLLVAVYPKGFANPIRLVKETLLISGRFPVNDAVNTNGVWLPQPPPWTYLPTWFGAQLPLLVTIASLVFLVAWIVRMVRLGRRMPGSRDHLSWLMLSIPVALQAALFPLLAIAVHSTIYNAVRQFLFVPPALAVLAALGIQVLWGILRPRGRGVWAYVLMAAVAVGIVVPVVAQARLFPYTYVYFNAVAALKPVDGNWATDYWRASGPDIVRIVPSTGPVSCIYIDAKHPMRPCEDDATLAPYWALRATGDVNEQALEDGQYWLVRENNGDVSTPDGCTLNNSLTRPLFGQDVTIAQVFRCQLP